MTAMVSPPSVKTAFVVASGIIVPDTRMDASHRQELTAPSADGSQPGIAASEASRLVIRAPAKSDMGCCELR